MQKNKVKYWTSTYIAIMRVSSIPTTYTYGQKKKTCKILEGSFIHILNVFNRNSIAKKVLLNICLSIFCLFIPFDMHNVPFSAMQPFKYWRNTLPSSHLLREVSFLLFFFFFFLVNVYMDRILLYCSANHITRYTHNWCDEYRFIDKIISSL